MSNKILVSIIIPIYNTEKYLPQCVDSVLSQTYKTLEIILVDDGSKDGSGRIADKIAERDSRVRVIHTANQGVSRARNTGLDKVHGDFIAFVDSDDLIHENYIINLLNIANAIGADIVTNGVTLSDNSDRNFLSSNVSRDVVYRKFDRNSALIALYEGNLEKGNNGQQLIRTKIIKKISPAFDPSMSIGEDFDFLARAITQSNVVAVDDRKMYLYRKNENSAVHKPFNINQYNAIENIQRTGRSMLKEIPELEESLNLNLLVSSISYGALMFREREKFNKEFDKIKKVIKKHRRTFLFNKRVKRNARIKIGIVNIFGINIGLILIKRLIRL